MGGAREVGEGKVEITGLEPKKTPKTTKDKKLKKKKKQHNQQQYPRGWIPLGKNKGLSWNLWEHQCFRGGGGRGPAGRELGIRGQGQPK